MRVEANTTTGHAAAVEVTSENGVVEQLGVAKVDARDRTSERGAGVVEWLGISALSIGMLVVLFTAMEALGLDVVNQIRGSLGL